MVRLWSTLKAAMNTKNTSYFIHSLVNQTFSSHREPFEGALASWTLLQGNIIRLILRAKCPKLIRVTCTDEHTDRLDEINN